MSVRSALTASLVLALIAGATGCMTEDELESEPDQAAAVAAAIDADCTIIPFGGDDSGIICASPARPAPELEHGTRWPD